MRIVGLLAEYCSPEVLFETCVDMKFMGGDDDDDDDNDDYDDERWQIPANGSKYLLIVY